MAFSRRSADDTAPVRSLLLLADLPADLTHLAIACGRCPRRGQLVINRLIAAHGLTASLHVATQNVNADCPNKDNDQIQTRCDLFYPGLAALLRRPSPPD